MPTGSESALLVLDVDMPDGDATLNELTKSHEILPKTALSLTGGGGKQFFFRFPEQSQIRNSAGALGRNLDVRGEGGYVVLPPSNHITGRKYQWADGQRIDQVDVADPPVWLIELCETSLSQNGHSEHPTNSEQIPEGQRNDRLYRLARGLRLKSIPQAGVLAAVQAANEASCNPPMTSDEVRAIVANAFKQPHRANFDIKDASKFPTFGVGDPMILARSFAAAHAIHPEGRILHRWDTKFWVWNGTHWIMREDEDARASLWHYLHDEIKLVTQEEKQAAASSRLVSDVLDALKGHVNIVKEALTPPCWVGEASPLDISPHEVIATRGGLVHLPTGETFPSTPRFFTFTSVPCDYEAASVPASWMGFLETIWPDDPQSVATLQEIFGYMLTFSMEQQKIFMIIGPTRSGKGTIGRVLQTLLGPNAVARPVLSDFGHQFGLEKLIGRTLAIISDARLDSDVSMALLVERLLSISGEDGIDVARKYRSDWIGTLRTRFLFLTNELPRVWDASGALPGRFVILETKKSFYGQEDHTLFSRLEGELSGILNWAIEGWRRLRERGYFVQPERVGGTVEDFSRLASPLLDFVGDRCTLETEADTAIWELYKEYRSWCEDQGSRPAPANIFGRDLRSAVQVLTFYRPHAQPRRVRGIRLRSFGSSEGWDQ